MVKGRLKNENALIRILCRLMCSSGLQTIELYKNIEKYRIIIKHIIKINIFSLLKSKHIIYKSKSRRMKTPMNM